MPELEGDISNDDAAASYEETSVETWMVCSVDLINEGVLHSHLYEHVSGCVFPLEKSPDETEGTD